MIAHVTSELIEELNRTWWRKGTNNAGLSEKEIKTMEPNTKGK